MSKISSPVSKQSHRPVMHRGIVRQPTQSRTQANDNALATSDVGGSRVQQPADNFVRQNSSTSTFARPTSRLTASTPQRQSSVRASRGLSNSSTTTQYADKSAGEAIEKLKKTEGQISGDAMRKAIDKGISDLDGNAVGKEFDDFAKFAKENPDKLSAEAKGAMRVYKSYVDKAKEDGKPGISQADFAQMKKDMAKVKYADESAGQAIEKLKSTEGQISGDDMREAIDKGIADLDGNAVGKEFADFARFAKENPDKLSAEAKGAMRVYKNYANKTHEAGKPGISQADFAQMKKDMAKVHYNDESAGQAIEKLKNTEGQIKGWQLRNAIAEGSKDADKQVVGNEYKDFANFAAENADRLGPLAKRNMEIYQSWAEAAQAQGQSGLTDQDFDSMIGEMLGHDPKRAAGLHKTQSSRTQILTSDRGRVIQPDPKK